MHSLLQSLARRLLPGQVRAAAHALVRQRHASYSGGYDSFAAAKRDSIGYADPAIFEATRNAARAVKRGEAAYERGGVAHRKPVYAWAALACLQHAALSRQTSPQRPMHVIDFGGSLGAVYYQNRRFLDAIPLRWSVVEQPHYVACGNAEFADERLRFFESIAQAAERAPADVILFSASLEYLDTPFDMVTEAAALRPAFIIVAGSHLTDAAEDEFKVQRIRPPYHPAVLALRALSKPKLTALMDRLGYAMEAAFIQGFLFQRKADAGGSA